MATAALSTRVAFGPDTTNVVPPPFTDYSRWERKPVRLHTPRSSPKLSTIFDLPSHQRSPRLRQHNCGYGHGHVPARGTGVGKLFAVEATRSVTSPAKSKSDAVKVSPPRRRLKTETAAHKILKVHWFFLCPIYSVLRPGMSDIYVLFMWCLTTLTYMHSDASCSKEEGFVSISESQGRTVSFQVPTC